VYSPSLSFQFVLDDHRFTSDPRIQEWGHVWDYFSNYVWAQFTGGPPSFYRPVFLLWMRLNFLLNELSPWGWHLLSIAKHVVAGELLGILVWRLLRDPLAAIMAAALFVLHPAQTESVSWVTVPDPLMSIGLILSTLFYLRYMDGSPTGIPPLRKKSKASTGHDSQPSPGWLVASTCAYFAALFAKETAIIFPAVIFALDLCTRPGPLSKPKSTAPPAFNTRLAPALRHTAPFLVVTAIYLLLRLHALHGQLAPATQHLPWRTMLLSWPATLWFYLKVLLWPIHSYSFADPTLAESLSMHGVLLPLLGLLCTALILSAGLLWAYRKARSRLPEIEGLGTNRALVIGTLLLLLPFLLTLNLNALNPGDFLHGRYTYLPLAGLMLLLATGWHVLHKSRVMLLAVAGALTIAFAALTFVQQSQWKDDSTVFTVAHQLAPHNDRVARNLADTRVQGAIQLSEQERCSEALPLFDQVIREYPQDWYAWAGLGDCYVQLNDLVKGEEARAVDISQDKRLIEHWQELRAHMGLSTNAAPN
jgi:tetratricopeptide (TPR) repeat protein